MTAEPLAAPGQAPSDHQPTRRGLDGGMRAPPRARMPSTRADTPSLGTDTRTGFAGTGLPGFVDLGDVANDGVVGTADVVPALAFERLDADGPAAACCRPSSAGSLLNCR